MVRVPFLELQQALAAALRKLAFHPPRALLCARLFAETTRDGVYTHGLNRFPRFARMIRAGRIDIDARPEFVRGFGCMERWDGHCGPGNLNAHQAMDRALSLAR